MGKTYKIQSSRGDKKDRLAERDKARKDKQRRRQFESGD